MLWFCFNLNAKIESLSEEIKGVSNKVDQLKYQPKSESKNVKADMEKADFVAADDPDLIRVIKHDLLDFPSGQQRSISKIYT